MNPDKKLKGRVETSQGHLFFFALTIPVMIDRQRYASDKTCVDFQLRISTVFIRHTWTWVQILRTSS